MNVYVAGASKELVRCRYWMKQLRNIDIPEIVITHDWTIPVEKEMDQIVVPKIKRIEYARQDLNGVSAADIFWLLVPKEQSIGAWVELGYALSLDRVQVITSGEHKVLFQELASRSFVTDDDAFEFIVKEV